jgi:hypothetical protein
MSLFSAGWRTAYHYEIMVVRRSGHRGENMIARLLLTVGVEMGLDRFRRIPH